MIKTIYLDMDGVLNNFGERFIIEILEREYITLKPDFYGYNMMKWIEDEEENENQGFGKGKIFFEEVLNRINFWDNISPSIEFIIHLKDLVEFTNQEGIKLYICTKPYNYDWNPQLKLNWWKRNFKECPDIPMIFMDDKSLLAKPDTLLVDDYDENVIAFSKAGGKSVLWKTFYNFKEPLSIINSVKALIELVKLNNKYE